MHKIDIMGISEIKLLSNNMKFLLENNDNLEYWTWWDSESI